MAVSFTGARHQLNIALRPILLQVYSKRDACHQSFSSLDGVRQHMASSSKIEISDSAVSESASHSRSHVDTFARPHVSTFAPWLWGLSMLRGVSHDHRPIAFRR